ncbi:sigma-70 family RNA polymerase sigma factor [Flexivirga alba]|uniref:RNA polymerase sigma factor n=1 Tax=Flexivirga alba TaxID=702742 RepID=A0ABW2ABX2_9MICO
MSAELLERARAGDREAFTALVEPHHRELHVHCYRMLGSVQDAEDVLQDTLLAAWLGLAGFEGRSSVRTWLYRIATNRCLNHLRSAKRQPATTAAAMPVPAPEPTRLGEVPWLQPYPDVLLEELPDRVPGPEARYEAREAISLAFITAVQLLPPNQRAALLMRDVLGYRAKEAAELLDLTEDAVTNALKRARATLDAAQVAGQPTPTDESVEQVLLDRFVTAFSEHDVDGLVALMSDDVWVRMPPLPFEYRGTEAVHRFFTAIHPHWRQSDRLVPVRANGQPAWGAYSRDRGTGIRHLTGLYVLGVDGGRICELTRFETTLAPYFGLPRTLD